MREKRAAAKTAGVKKIALLLVLCLCLGMVLGIVQAVRLGADSLRQIENQLSAGFQGQPPQSGAFVQSVLKNGATMLLLWLLAFLPLGNWAAAAVLAVKAMGYGYTAAVLIRTYGGAGFLYTAAHLGPQGVILLAAIFYLCYVNYRRCGALRRKNSEITAKLMTEYFLTLLLAEICVVLAALI